MAVYHGTVLESDFIYGTLNSTMVLKFTYHGIYIHATSKKNMIDGIFPKYHGNTIKPSPKTY